MLSQNYLLPIISVLAENTLRKNACHFLLLLVGFDTLTYQKDYDRSPILVGHQAVDTLLSPQKDNSQIKIPSKFQPNRSYGSLGIYETVKGQKIGTRNRRETHT